MNEYFDFHVYVSTHIIYSKNGVSTQRNEDSLLATFLRRRRWVAALKRAVADETNLESASCR